MAKILRINDYQKDYEISALNNFLRDTFEIAFGDDAIKKEYTMYEVIAKLREFSDKAQHYDELVEESK